MKKLIAGLLSLFVISGCCVADNIYKDRAFDGTSSEQVLITEYNNSYFVNMTDGIFACSKDFETAEQLTKEYCLDPYIEDNKLYYIGDGAYNIPLNTLKSKDLSTEEIEVLYQFNNYQFYRHVDDVWYVGDGNKVVKIREEDGMQLFETSIKDLSTVEYINDDFFLYRLEYDNQTLMLFELESKSISKVFSLEEGKIGETVMCDGKNVYYCLKNEDGTKSLCKYNMIDKNHQILMEDGFGEEFNIYDGVCYYYMYVSEDDCGYIKAFNMKEDSVETLITTQYIIQDINISDNMLIYRRGDYGKQIEVLNLSDNSTKYLYEKYADITQRV